jgi:hypothetical protein
MNKVDVYALSIREEPIHELTATSEDGVTVSLSVRRLGEVGYAAAADLNDEAILDYYGNPKLGIEPREVLIAGEQAVVPSRASIWSLSQLAAAQVDGKYTVGELFLLMYKREETVRELVKQALDLGIYGERKPENPTVGEAQKTTGNG